MKNIVITGADRGLGYALCECFLQKGWCVFAGQYMPNWPQLAQLKEKSENRLIIVQLDTSSDDAVRRAAREVASYTNCIDMLICR